MRYSSRGHIVASCIAADRAAFLTGLHHITAGAGSNLTRLSHLSCPFFNSQTCGGRLAACVLPPSAQNRLSITQTESPALVIDDELHRHMIKVHSRPVCLPSRNPPVKDASHPLSPPPHPQPQIPYLPHFPIPLQVCFLTCCRETRLMHCPKLTRLFKIIINMFLLLN